MPICRLIFRLDFKVNFKMIDQAGGTLQLLDSITQGPEKKFKFFDQIGEKLESRLVEANAKDKEEDVPKWTRRIGVRPESIDVNIENFPGLNLHDIQNNYEFSKLIKITDEIRKKFQISNLLRAGLRIFYFNKIGNGAEDALKAFKDVLFPTFSSTAESDLGSISDIGITFDGSHEDKIAYHFRCGPYWQEESKRNKYLSIDIDKLGNNNNIIVDIDLYETNFTLNETVSFAKWCNPLLDKTKKIIPDVEKILKDKIIAQANNN